MKRKRPPGCSMTSAPTAPRPAWDGATMRSCIAGTSSASTSRGGSCERDRKSTRLNSSHSQISYAVFCLKKKTDVDSAHVLLQHHNKHDLIWRATLKQVSSY